jgi:prolyl-tRNA synthetase
MRYSRSLIPTLREDPADAEVVSHKLMVRAGYIRKVAAGIYNYLPLGLRVIKKVERIVREEMDAAGAQELLMPMIQPAELWQESGRWDFYGKELLRFKDRAMHDYCAGPTHEEVITDIARRELKSYRDLPKNLYQIQTKFRDEVRPRFGLMRGREFIMKDAYSFDADEKSAFESYEGMYQTYKRIFSRMGLTFRPVEAATGAIGGTRSHEFHVLADSGEDAIFFCDKCEYAANAERARVILQAGLNGLNKGLGQKGSKGYKEAATPGKKTIEEVSAFLRVRPNELVKTLLYKVTEGGRPGFIAVMLRGDDELMEPKLVKALLDAGYVSGADVVLEMASEAEVKDLTGADVGFAGPIGLKKGVKVIADASVHGNGGFVTGANKTDAHLVGVEWSDCGIGAFADIRRAKGGDTCGECGKGKLSERRGIEVGQVFYLGTKYSNKMRAVYLDEGGKEQLTVMGCYGIGITRTASAAIEQNHDDKGIIWPLAIAPFHVELISAGEDEKVKATAEAVYAELEAAGLEVLYDDRNERPGVKFADADLIGIPYHVIVGKKALDAGKLEMKVRRTGERKMVQAEEIIGLIMKELK